MEWILFESLLALAILVGIVAWTMAPLRKRRGGEARAIRRATRRATTDPRPQCRVRGTESVNAGIGASNSRPSSATHLVAAAHRAHRRVEARAGRVLEALARRELRLLADDARAAHFLHAVLAVGDDPVARQELRRDRARCS